MAPPIRTVWTTAPAETTFNHLQRLHNRPAHTAPRTKTNDAHRDDRCGYKTDAVIKVNVPELRRIHREWFVKSPLPRERAGTGTKEGPAGLGKNPMTDLKCSSP